jgi:hypothetical protein
MELIIQPPIIIIAVPKRLDSQLANAKPVINPAGSENKIMF